MHQSMEGDEVSETPIYQLIGDAYKVKTDTITYPIDLYGKEVKIEFKVVRGLPEYHANQKFITDKIEELQKLKELNSLHGEIADLYTDDTETLAKCLTLAALAVDPVWKREEAWLYLAQNVCGLFMACYRHVIKETSMDATAIVEKEVDAEKKDSNPKGTETS